LLFAATAFLAWTLLGAAVGSGSGGTSDPQTPLTFTGQNPSGSFRIARATVASAPTILVVDLTRVVNPARTPVSFFVYLTGWDRCDTQRYLIGNFALFPPDHGGKFLLNPSDAFRKYRAECSSSGDARLILEMKRLNSSQPWGQVKVLVTPPAWNLDPK
jgi:hypothetical protein